MSRRRRRRPTSAPVAGPPPPPRPNLWYAVGIGVGAMTGLGVMSLLTIGILLLGVALVGAMALFRGPHGLFALPGWVSGLAAGPVVGAVLNRSGPGSVCTGSGCTDQTSPWPWVAVALVLAGLGAYLFLRVRRKVTAPTG